MVIDASAILAILGDEPEAELFAEKIASEDFTQTDLQIA
jgi:uncharacterized protein with PIN domain